MKKNYYLILFFIFSLLFGSCNPKKTQNDSSFIEINTQTSPQNTSSADQYKIALVMKTLTNPFFIDMEKGAREAENELGIELIVKTAAQETSILQQIEIVEELIESEVDSIVIAPGDSVELIPVLIKAQEAGIQVVNIDNQLEENLAKELGLKNVPFISVNNVEGGYLSAKFISDQITTPTKAVILEGIRKALNSQDRLEGAQQAFSENENIDLIATETANWKIDEAYEVIQQLFQSDPDIGVIFCSNDMMALGVIQYLSENNLDHVLVAGFDNLQEAQQAILDDQLQCTIDQQAALQGYLGVESAVKMIEGSEVPLKTQIDVILITKEILEQE